jgi:hypothetical protein
MFRSRQQTMLSFASAAAAHQPLQEYLRPRLIQEASEPVLEEVLDRAGGRSGGSVPLKDAVTAVRSDAA